MSPQRYLLFGATGGTGKHFLTQALADGNKVRALVRTPSKLTPHDGLEIVQGSITEPLDMSSLVKDVDYVVLMLGDKEVQKTTKICFNLIQQLIPSMREHNVKRLLYQAGGLTKPYGEELSWILWALRKSVAFGFEGQHQDNEAVGEYLATQAKDIEWIIHRAGIANDGPSKGTLARSHTRFSVANHLDCATYSYKVIKDDKAVHTTDFSYYV